MRFRTTVQLDGKTATGLLVPPEVVAGLGESRKPAVTVTLNGFTYRSTIASRGGRYLIPVSADIRKQSGVAAGDELEVDVELDTAPREITVPGDLAERLAAEPAVLDFFSSLSYSNKSVHTLSIEQAKTPETRARRVDKAMDTLRQGKAR
jgi:bifunctional DNA-binding transcriptional regulator/antitoxin component of YhaV-PrlF toxin-antitoxin module